MLDKRSINARMGKVMDFGYGAILAAAPGRARFG